MIYSELFQEQLIYLFNIKSKSCFDIKTRLMKTLCLPLMILVLYLVEKIAFLHRPSEVLLPRAHFYTVFLSSTHFLDSTYFSPTKELPHLLMLSLAEDKEYKLLAKFSKVAHIVNCEPFSWTINGNFTTLQNPEEVWTGRGKAP